VGPRTPCAIISTENVDFHMMSIAFMGVGGADYYLSIAREDYFLKGGEPPGIWWGDGAKTLKLSGQVRPHDFHALFRAITPGGEALVQNAGKEDRQLGCELTFLAPKTVSALWSQGDETLRRETQAAHSEAVRAALAYLQEEIPLTRRGRVRSKPELAGLVVALFEHATNRDLAPALHTHALLTNVCTRQDGSTGSILSKPVYRHKTVVGALYRVELAAQLECRLGVRCCLAEGASAFAIEGSGESMERVFSRGRAAIEEGFKSSGLEGTATAAIAAFPRGKGEIRFFRKVGVSHQPRSWNLASWRP